MTVTVYRSDCYLLDGDHAIVAFSIWRFEPIAGARGTTPTGYEKVRERSEPVEVITPPLSRITKGRLVTWDDPGGIDAESVYGLAKRRERGFKLKEAPSGS